MLYESLRCNFAQIYSLRNFGINYVVSYIKAGFHVIATNAIMAPENKKQKRNRKRKKHQKLIKTGNNHCRPKNQPLGFFFFFFFFLFFFFWRQFSESATIKTERKRARALWCNYHLEDRCNSLGYNGGLSKRLFPFIMPTITAVLVIAAIISTI